MQTQQVSGFVGSGMLYTSKNTPAKSSDGSFEQLIQMSQNAGVAQEQVQKLTETTKKDAVAEVTRTEKPEQTTDVAEEKTDTMTTTEEKTELQKAEGTEEATDVEAVERVAGILNQVMEVVKDVLDLSEEQLNSFMEELGIAEVDLLQPETLQNLVLMVNSEQDAVILLTDAELLTQVNQLIEQVEQVLEQAGVTPEELMQTMESPEFEAMVTEAMVTEAMEQLAESEANNPGLIEDTTNVEQEDTKEIVEAAAQKETTATVENAEADSTVEVVDVPKEGKEMDTSEKEQKNDASTDVDQFANQFVQNLQKAAEEIGEVTGQKDMVQMIREIADQILEKVKVSVTPETTSLEIVLTPEELGRVNLTVTAEQDGMMKAKFVTENELAKEAIERNLVQFKEMLNEQGLKVDSIEVTVGNFEFDKNGQAGESSQEERKNSNRNFMTDEEIGQKDETDQLARVFMEGGESTVNYMA